MKDQIRLIDGQYPIEDAAEILYAVLNDKIKYHNIQVSSFEERNLGDINHSKARLVELNHSKNKVASLVQQTKDRDVAIRIKANIEIEVLETEVAQ